MNRGRADLPGGRTRHRAANRCHFSARREWRTGLATGTLGSMKRDARHDRGSNGLGGYGPSSRAVRH
jgi:hypothetical protein